MKGFIQTLVILIFTGQVFGQLSDKTVDLQPATDQNMVNLAKELTDFYSKSKAMTRAGMNCSRISFNNLIKA